MEVIIDGRKYIPEPPVCENASPLEIRMEVGDLGREVSLREYFHELLTTLWEEEEGFNGKRPFGNSGWQYDVFAFLVKAGVVEGSFDEDGYIEDVNKEQAYALIPGLIAAAMGIAK